MEKYSSLLGRDTSRWLERLTTSLSAVEIDPKACGVRTTRSLPLVFVRGLCNSFEKKVDRMQNSWVPTNSHCRCITVYVLSEVLRIPLCNWLVTSLLTPVCMCALVDYLYTRIDNHLFRKYFKSRLLYHIYISIVNENRQLNPATWLLFDKFNFLIFFTPFFGIRCSYVT